MKKYVINFYDNKHHMKVKIYMVVHIMCLLLPMKAP